MTRVFVVARSTIARAGLERLVEAEAGLTLVGSSSSFADLTGKANDELPFDVALIDVVDERDEQTLLATFVAPIEEEASEMVDAAFVVVLVRDVQSDFVIEMLRSGVRGVLPPEATAEEIVAAIEAASAGLVSLPPEAMSVLLLSSIKSFDEESLPATVGVTDGAASLKTREIDALTGREIEVLGMVAEGLGNKTIAWRLGISEHTVKFHVSSIFAKLGATSRTEAVMLGVKQGLIML